MAKSTPSPYNFFKRGGVVMGKSKKILLLILACGILLSVTYAASQFSKLEEPTIVGFFLGDVIETY